MRVRLLTGDVRFCFFACVRACVGGVCVCVCALRCLAALTLGLTHTDTDANSAFPNLHFLSLYT